MFNYNTKYFLSTLALVILIQTCLAEEIGYVAPAAGRTFINYTISVNGDGTCLIQREKFEEKIGKLSVPTPQGYLPGFICTFPEGSEYMVNITGYKINYGEDRNFIVHADIRTKYNLSYDIVPGKIHAMKDGYSIHTGVDRCNPFTVLYKDRLNCSTAVLKEPSIILSYKSKAKEERVMILLGGIQAPFKYPSGAKIIGGDCCSYGGYIEIKTSPTLTTSPTTKELISTVLPSTTSQPTSSIQQPTTTLTLSKPTYTLPAIIIGIAIVVGFILFGFISRKK